ncbi:MAG: YdcF family protein [Bdellovibrionales bacterium]|nr:YdcF family protein [Bdellovibrionales bacterium]
MRLQRGILFAGVFVSGLGAWAFYEESLKISGQTVTSWEEDHAADCAVVLTGGAGRVREGFEKLVISGVYPHATLRGDFSSVALLWRLDQRNIILEKRSGTTYGNAQQSLPLIEALHCRDMILITSRIHMYRSMRIFSSVFPESFPIYPRSIVQGSYETPFAELAIEVFKSFLFALGLLKASTPHFSRSPV